MFVISIQKILFEYWLWYYAEDEELKLSSKTEAQGNWSMHTLHPGWEMVEREKDIIILKYTIIKCIILADYCYH